jgi:hypothetical protein
MGKCEVYTTFQAENLKERDPNVEGILVLKRILKNVGVECGVDLSGSA